MGPGPPQRRIKRSVNGSTRAITTAGTHSTVVSQGGSAMTTDSPINDPSRMSDDTLDDANWNRRRYQREDEILWGLEEVQGYVQVPGGIPGSSVGIGGMSRPETAKSSGESYFTARVPPVNDLHPPVVSNPSLRPEDNRWMLQPPPKASIMSGKERASHRSRSGSGTSSRVELNLQRQVSEKQLRAKLERGQTPEMPSSGDTAFNIWKVPGRSGASPKTPSPRPPSAASSHKKRKRPSQTPVRPKMEVWLPSDHSSETVIHISPPETPSLPSPGATFTSPQLVRIRNSRKRLSTVISSGSGLPPARPISQTKKRNYEGNISEENSEPIRLSSPRHNRSHISTKSSDSVPYASQLHNSKNHSDVTSLKTLQDLVSPRALLNSRFVSAPLMEARIRLPPSDGDEDYSLQSGEWSASGFSGFSMSGEETGFWPHSKYFAMPERDPRLRWSVDF